MIMPIFSEGEEINNCMYVVYLLNISSKNSHLRMIQLSRLATATKMVQRSVTTKLGSANASRVSRARNVTGRWCLVFVIVVFSYVICHHHIISLFFMSVAYRAKFCYQISSCLKTAILGHKARCCTTIFITNLTS